MKANTSGAGNGSWLCFSKAKVSVCVYFGVGASALCQCMSETIFVKANFLKW